MPPTGAALAGDTLFTLGALGTLVSPALVVADALAPISSLDSLAMAGIGAAMLAVGATIALVAQAQMGAAWRAGIDTSDEYPLVTHGVFRFVRNPFYVGMSLASLGAALMAPTVAGFIAWTVLVIGCNIDVRFVEEPHLHAAHGATYQCYTEETGRFLPRRRARC